MEWATALENGHIIEQEVPCVNRDFDSSNFKYVLWLLAFRSVYVHLGPLLCIIIDYQQTEITFALSRSSHRPAIVDLGLLLLLFLPLLMRSPSKPTCDGYG